MMAHQTLNEQAQQAADAALMGAEREATALALTKSRSGLPADRWPWARIELADGALLTVRRFLPWHEYHLHEAGAASEPVSRDAALQLLTSSIGGAL